MKPRGKGSMGFTGNANGGLQTTGRFAFDDGRDGVSSDAIDTAAAEQKRKEALAKLEAFGKEIES
jgi:hypothetical protein